MKYLYLLLTLIFILFAGFQYNDPDPEVWILLYGYGAVISFLMFIGKMDNITWAFIGLLVYLITAVVDWPETFSGMENAMTMMNPEIEKARETSGMMLGAGIMLLYIIMIIRGKKTKTS